MKPIAETLSALRGQLIPVLDIREPEQAAAVAGVLAGAGATVLELTLRSPQAWRCLDAIRDAYPELVVGVGSVLEESQLRQAAQRKLPFAVSPGLSEQLVRSAQAMHMPLIPGVATASEVLNARLLGLRLVKLFPAELLGGIALLRALAGPLADMQFFPSGGINESNYRDYLAQANVFCVGASWLAPASDIEQSDWDAIRRRAEGAYGSC